MPVYKNAFAKHFTPPINGPHGYKGTTYFHIENNVLFIMLDCLLNKLAPGEESCEADIDDIQLMWLESVIDSHKDVEHIIVTGHVPVLSPVRKLSSSGIILNNQGESKFWKLLKEKNVDFYLCGEVHDVTSSFDLPVVQVAHGGLFGYNNRVNYMVMKFTKNKVDCTIKEFELKLSGEKLWQPGNNRPFESISINPEPVIKGKLTMLKEKGKKRIISEEGILSREANTLEKIMEDQAGNVEFTLKTHGYKMD